jgi:hypothetical protein
MSQLAPALSERNATELERCDRHLSELMQEVRVAQTGVQVLLGFLLTVPFTVRFDSLSAGERALYYGTLAPAGAAAAAAAAPTEGSLRAQEHRSQESGARSPPRRSGGLGRVGH